MKAALVLGSTGLVGNLLLQQLLQSNNYQQVYVYVRKPLNLQHPKLQQVIVNFNDINTAVPVQDVFCCLGTTIKKAGRQ